MACRLRMGGPQDPTCADYPGYYSWLLAIPLFKYPLETSGEGVLALLFCGELYQWSLHPADAAQTGILWAGDTPAAAPSPSLAQKSALIHFSWFGILPGGRTMAQPRSSVWLAFMIRTPVGTHAWPGKASERGADVCVCDVCVMWGNAH